MNHIAEKMRQVRHLRAELSNAEDELMVLLSNATCERPALPQIETIQRIVADFYGVPERTMRAKLRSDEIARPRQVAMTIAREVTSYSLERVGDSFGGRDHGTVCHAAKAVADRCATDRRFAEEVETLRVRCRSALHGKIERLRVA